MGLIMDWITIKARFEDSICFLQFNRPNAKNTINDLMIQECREVIDQCYDAIKIVVFEGLPEVFCFGADLQGNLSQGESKEQGEYNPQSLYELWMKMARGPFITISHVRGQANAGGMGFVAASDIVIADNTASFSLSELLFGLLPAMVLPFLIQKIGYQKANYMVLMTKPICVQQAYEWGIVDTYQEKSEQLLWQHISRLKRLPKMGIEKYKNYMGKLNNSVVECMETAVKTNTEVFSDSQNLERIYQFVRNGIYPWEN